MFQIGCYHYPHEHMLRDRRTEEAIGWYISDSHIGLGEKQEVICANIAYWRATKIPSIVTSLGPVKGFDYTKRRKCGFYWT